ncbi:hypothetical protein GQ53DRAFT_437719 [Thozetella sp. PMI_491]|nr:hypothetical protein GQ53DRAFT_437719 [Thozetella sp. PMI_491]
MAVEMQAPKLPPPGPGAHPVSDTVHQGHLCFGATEGFELGTAPAGASSDTQAAHLAWAADEAGGELGEASAQLIAECENLDKFPNSRVVQRSDARQPRDPAITESSVYILDPIIQIEVVWHGGQSSATTIPAALAKTPVAVTHTLRVNDRPI